MCSYWGIEKWYSLLYMQYDFLVKYFIKASWEYLPLNWHSQCPREWTWPSTRTFTCDKDDGSRRDFTSCHKDENYFLRNQSNIHCILYIPFEKIISMIYCRLLFNIFEKSDSY